MDLDNLQNSDTTLSDSELSLNSTTACNTASTSNLDVPEDLFASDAKSKNPVPDPEAEILDRYDSFQRDRIKFYESQDYAHPKAREVLEHFERLQRRERIKLYESHYAFKVHNPSTKNA